MKAIFLVEPIPKGRARTVVKNGRVMSYTPVSTRNAEAAIRAELARCGEFYPAGTPLELTMRFVLTKPVSVSKKRLYPVVKPDGSNLQKLVEDACNGFIWTDDSQVCRWHGEKIYGTPPRIEMEVSPIGEMVLPGDPLLPSS